MCRVDSELNIPGGYYVCSGRECLLWPSSGGETGGSSGSDGTTNGGIGILCLLFTNN